LVGFLKIFFKECHYDPIEWVFSFPQKSQVVRVGESWGRKNFESNNRPPTNVKHYRNYFLQNILTSMKALLGKGYRATYSSQTKAQQHFSKGNMRNSSKIFAQNWGKNRQLEIIFRLDNNHVL